ncbi:diguanylate cyclase domain-containing protein [Paenibacillus puldeungensis]|uniref:Diguanylate cyclase domain-containing protein n=2 Tax=Paenibacillus puldeungensis TaxID=696536 RepID=A0ABW3RWY3_9BACL
MSPMLENVDRIGCDEPFRQIVENSLDTIKVLDLQGKIRYASPSHRGVYGREAREYMGESAFDSVFPEDLSKLVYALEVVMQRNKPVTVQLRKQHQRGHWIWVEASCSPIMDENASIQGIVLISRDISERKEYEKKLQYMAFHDYLTGLYNRRKFMQLCESALELASGRNIRLAILILDLNQFKWINDHLGHDMGDVVLQEFSKRLLQCKRDHDFIGRLSGDEFAILMNQVESEADIIQLIEHIMAALELPFELAKGAHQVTASIGASMYPDHSESLSMLIKRADLALYKVKGEGKSGYNGYCIYQNS